MEKNFCVYAHINKINNKIYVGQTSQDPIKRWDNGHGYRHNEHFTSAINKYGWDNFEHLIMHNYLTQDEANFYERYYIEELDLLNPEKGYNKMEGGISSPFSELWKDEIFREKMKKQQSELMKERWKSDEFKNRTIQGLKDAWTPEMREEAGKRLSARLLEQWKDPEYRKARSEDMKRMWEDPKTRVKLLEQSSKNAINNWQNKEYRKKMCKAVKNIETGKVFESAAAAARWCGLADRSSVTKCLTGNNKSAGKHPETKEPLHWEYAAPEEVM